MMYRHVYSSDSIGRRIENLTIARKELHVKIEYLSKYIIMQWLGHIFFLLRAYKYASIHTCMHVYKRLPSNIANCGLKRCM